MSTACCCWTSPRVCRRTPRCSARSARTTPKRPGTPERSIRSPRACCRCASARQPSSRNSCSTRPSATRPRSASASRRRPATPKARSWRCIRSRWRARDVEAILPRLHRAPGADPARAIPRSSSRGAVITNTRAPASTSRARRARSRSWTCGCSTGSRRMPCWTSLCSKGTYVRVLAEDIGRALGCGAHLAGLRRTATGGFGIDAAVTLEAPGSDGRRGPRRHRCCRSPRCCATCRHCASPPPTRPGSGRAAPFRHPGLATARARRSRATNCWASPTWRPAWRSRAGWSPPHPRQAIERG